MKHKTTFGFQVQPGGPVIDGRRFAIKSDGPDKKARIFDGSNDPLMAASPGSIYELHSLSSFAYNSTDVSNSYISR